MQNRCTEGGCEIGQANKSIACTVNQCAYHCQEKDYCSLSQIQVVTHEADPTVPQCTDCGSFRKK